MKFSLSWLKQYLDVDVAADEIADALTMAGLEVDSVTDRYAWMDDVLVARILSVSPHPNADRLTVCEVEANGEKRSVVCGAPNVAEGMLVALALPGAVLPDGREFGKTVIRGVESNGMLCSEAELVLGDDADGIIDLTGKAEPGVKLSQALNLSDSTIEIDLTPNRPDCLSLIGIAREVAAAFRNNGAGQVQEPDVEISEPNGEIAASTSVEIADPELCPRYAAMLLRDVTIKPSPWWLQDRLISVGIRPINNIVDVTNFVMMEMGQPLHAFDFDELHENRIVVKRVGSKSKFTTLDEKERELSDEMLMICDGEKGVALAGVMGGMNSEISDKTVNVLLESAYFLPTSIRKTSRSLGLNSDASHRFERGIDPEITVRAMHRAASLMAEVSGATIVNGHIDNNPIKPEKKEVKLTAHNANRLLGTEFSTEEVIGFLDCIGFDITTGNDGVMTVVPPSYRVDVTRPEDLMEEIARISGYNNIPVTFPDIPSNAKSGSVRVDAREKIRDIMAGMGFTEVYTYSFMGKNAPDSFKFSEGDERRKTLGVLNPLTDDLAVLRTSIAPGLMNMLRTNISHNTKNVRAFETGKIFIKTTDREQPIEREFLACVQTGARNDESWHAKDVECDFYDLKGTLEAFLNALGVNDAKFAVLPADDCCFTRPGKSAMVSYAGKEIGIIGEITKNLAKEYDLGQSAFYFELNMDVLLENLPGTITATPIPRFPAIARDATLIIDRAQQANEIIENILSKKEKLVEKAVLFDVYEGKPIKEGKKSVSFRIIYRSWEKTLEDESVNSIHKMLVDDLIKEFKADLPA